MEQIRFLDENDTSSIITQGSRPKDPVKKAWCHTQWTCLSLQAQNLNMPEVYFDQNTRLLNKIQNKPLWSLLNRLYDLLGPDKAPYATPVMYEGGRVEWHNYADECKGVVAEIVEE